MCFLRMTIKNRVFIVAQTCTLLSLIILLRHIMYRRDVFQIKDKETENSNLRCIITFRSMTAALAGSRILSESSFPNHVTDIPPDLTGRGCAYGIEVMCHQAELATILLERNKIKYGKLVKV